MLEGKMKSGELVMVGRPPAALAQYMKSDNTIMMPQKAVKKTVLTKEDGGKHALGRIVVDELPAQVSDPMAITGNTTEHANLNDNSIVVWTDWITQDGHSVIVPIRIDITGRIGVYNNINTVFDAYNPQYVDDLLRDGNTKYTRNGKNIHELLSQRRKVPEVSRSDASSEASVADATSVVKTSRKDAAQRVADTRTAERIAEGHKQAAAQQKADAKLDTQQERYEARITALEEQIAELKQRAKDERTAGQINTAIERRAGRQAVEDTRTAERIAEGRIRSEERQKAADALAEQKQKAAEREAALRQRKDDRIATLEGRIVADQVNRNVRTETQKYTERIMANAKTLTAWLIRPTDDNHVPEAMRNRIAKFIETIDFGDDSK